MPVKDKADLAKGILMLRKTACILFASTALAPLACMPGGLGGGQSSLTTPLQKGIFSGKLMCEVSTIPAGLPADDPSGTPVTFEIDEFGIPIVLGEQISVGRKVPLNGATVEYTRVEASANGIVVHSTGKDASGNLLFTSIATIENAGTRIIRYKITITAFDSTGTYVSNCDSLLADD
jgi:hypothetical protein